MTPTWPIDLSDVLGPVTPEKPDDICGTCGRVFDTRCECKVRADGYDHNYIAHKPADPDENNREAALEKARYALGGLGTFTPAEEIIRQHSRMEDEPTAVREAFIEGLDALRQHTARNAETVTTDEVRQRYAKQLEEVGIPSPTYPNMRDRELTNEVAALTGFDAEKLNVFADTRVHEGPIDNFQDRDFRRDAREELADARNYLVWAIRRGDDPSANRLGTALAFVVRAYHELLQED